jgi:hypothetical protein
MADVSGLGRYRDFSMCLVDLRPSERLWEILNYARGFNQRRDVRGGLVDLSGCRMRASGFGDKERRAMKIKKHQWGLPPHNRGRNKERNVYSKYVIMYQERFEGPKRQYAS